MAKSKTEIHVTAVFDGELDAADVFVSLIAQKYGQNTGCLLYTSQKYYNYGQIASGTEQALTKALTNTEVMLI